MDEQEKGSKIGYNPNIDSQESINEKYTTNNNHSDTTVKQNPITEIEIPSTIIDEYRRNQYNQRRENRKIFYVGIGTLIAILCYTAIAAYQGCEMRKAAEATKTSADSAKIAADTAKNTFDLTHDYLLKEIQKQTKAMQDAADANGEAVDLAERNINATQEQSRLDQRAWVGVIDTIPPSFKDGDIAVYIKEGEKNTGFGVVIGNSGKTPARKVKNKQRITAYPANAKFIPSYPPFNEGERSVSVIQPGMKPILYFPLFV